MNHYMVVRAASHSGGYPLGSILNGIGTVTYTFDMAKSQEQRLLRRKQVGILGEARRKRDPEDQWNVAGFADKGNWTVDPTRLFVVALVQDVRTGDVLQAQMVHVNTGPYGELLQLP